MDWNRLDAWLYENGQPDYEKIERHQIGHIYIDPRSTNAAAVLADLKAHRIPAGIYECPVWYGTPSPSQFVGTVSRHANQLIPRNPVPALTPPLMLDLEAVPKDWIAQTVELYRNFQPRRPTAITTEPYQDGTVIPTDTLKTAAIHWYPQLYRGDMSPVDGAAVMLEPCRWGFPADMLHPFYDGRALPGDHRDGCVFTLERLP